MKWMMACAALVVAVAACGGKVFVDSPGQSTGTGTTTSVGGAGGSGGAGGAINSTGNTMVSTGDVNPCIPMGCSGGSDGSCGCSAICNNQNLEVDCQPITGGVACVCIENNVAIDKCQQTAANACDVLAGCCAHAFFGQ